MPKRAAHLSHRHVAVTSKESVTSRTIGHVEDKCWKKFPHLNLHKSEKSKSNAAFVAAQLEESNTPDEQIGCLMADCST